MQALLMTTAGTPDVLQLHDIPTPPLPSRQHLRVQLVAAGVNHVDTKLRTKPAYHPDKLPAILGCDGAGIVAEVGADVSRFKVGDTVYFCNGGIGDEAGCYAEFTTLHEDFCAAAPRNIPLADCAALPLVFLTAWEALVDRANLQAGQTVLIHAGMGGVGHIALQLAHHLGARVAVTVSNPTKAQVAQALCAEKCIFYREQDFVTETLAWTEGKGADVVFDTVGGEVFTRSFAAARIGGKVVSILSTPLTLADTQLARLRNLTLGYELMLTPQVLGLHDERVRQRQLLEKCSELVEQGKLGVLISQRYPLAHAADAHRLMEQGGMIGKVLLEISPAS